MTDLARDIRLAVRTLLRQPGFSAAVVVALALGLGVNSALFSIANLFVLRPLPVAEPERLVAVLMGPRAEPRVWGGLSYPDYLAVKDEKQTFSGLVAVLGDGGPIYDRQPSAADAGGVPDTIAWEFLDGGALQVLGVPAFLGRALSPSDDQPGRDPVVMISHALWKKRYHGDPKVIGRKIYFGSNALTLVGVMPPTFKGVQDGLQFGWLDAWVPLQIRRVIYGRTDPNFFDDRARRELRVFGRLQPGVSPRQAELRLEALAGVLGKEFPATNAGTRLAVTSEIEARYGSGYSGVKLALAVAMFIAGLVLLIACANVANLLLARGVKRTRELGIRAALGAGRGRILRWLLIESLLLSLAGGALGLLLARWFGAALHLFLPPMPSTPSLDFQADWRTVAWSVVLALLTGLAFGAAPAWNAARADIVRALKTDRGAEGGRFGTNRLKQALVIAQLSVSVVVLVSSGLFMRSLQKIKNIDPGYRTDTLLSALVNPSLFTDDTARHRQFFEQLQARLEGLPGVQSVSSSMYMPLINFQGQFGPVVAEGRPAPAPNQAPPVGYNVTYGNYFETMGTPILLGRSFAVEEHRGTPATVIINAELARRLFGAPAAALGRRLRIGDPQTPLLRIVGVARDGHYRSLLEPPTPWIYLPQSLPWQPDTNEGMRTVLIRASDRRFLGSIAAGLRRDVQALDARLPIEQVQIGDAHLIWTLYEPRLAAQLGTILALLALGLATMGIYSVMIYSVNQRAREIGIRMALGGQVSDVLRLVLKQGLHLIAIGVGIGTAVALLVGRLMSGLLFGVSPADPPTLLASVAVLVVVTLLATAFPARRAAQVDPLVALRHD